MDLYILGIGGTFMGHLALLAKQMGFNVSGCDYNVYSPMREMLIENDIQYDEGYDTGFLKDGHKTYVIGNAVSRGNPMVEAILNQQRSMVSGPQWLAEHVLRNRWVIAISGTHGKTTTTSMVTWILKCLGQDPGYLIGGAAKGFDRAANVGSSRYFVIEADEYDTAFFDKRSKFIHYRPKTLVINNVEFDHADIFDDLAAIQKTFHHVVRIVPSEGRVIYPDGDDTITEILEKGCWSEQFRLTLGSNTQTSKSPSGTGLQLRKLTSDASQLEVTCAGDTYTIHWDLIGDHNAANAGAALAAVEHLGIPMADAVEALQSFPGVARRMDVRFSNAHRCVYDDFAHHPTAIALSLAALRARVGTQRIVAFIEPRSNTMAMGVHQQSLIGAVQNADEVFWLRRPGMALDLEALCERAREGSSIAHHICDSAEQMIEGAIQNSYGLQENSEQEHWLCMSNGAFGGLFQLLETQFAEGDQ